MRKNVTERSEISHTVTRTGRGTLLPLFHTAHRTGTPDSDTPVTDAAL